MSNLKPSKTDQGEIHVSIGFTKNLGDFNSARADVGATVPVRPGETWQEAIDRTYPELEMKFVEIFKQVEKQVT